MLDLGTGSGLLAIAAKMLGARRADAFDFDPACVRIAKENARANGVRVAVKRADVLRWQPPRAWHVVAANLYSEVLTGAAKTIARATAPGGVLIFSGVLRAQEKGCLRAFAACGFKPDRIVRKGKWVTAEMTKAG
jgi:ribosomal protein L11 methyltransferase